MPHENPDPLTSQQAECNPDGERRCVPCYSGTGPCASVVPPLRCRHCGDPFDTERPCPSPDAGKRPLIDSGIGGHRFEPPESPPPPAPLSAERLREIRALAIDALNEPTGVRPPYGETGARFYVDSARTVLANLEHEEPSQANMDTLFVELRCACDEVDLLRKAVATVPELLAERDRLQAECKRLQRVGLESARIGGEKVFTREQVERIVDDDEVRR